MKKILALLTMILIGGETFGQSYRYYFVINNCDNKIIVYINNGQVLKYEHEYDTPDNKSYDITDYLQASSAGVYVNKMVVEGWNYATYGNYNPYHFKYSVEEKNMQTGEVKVILTNEKKADTPNRDGPESRVEVWPHDIIKKS